MQVFVASPDCKDNNASNRNIEVLANDRCSLRIVNFGVILVVNEIFKFHLCRLHLLKHLFRSLKRLFFDTVYINERFQLNNDR